jgi:phage terminase small subunit
VLEYAKDFNGTQAAIRAGYSHKTAYSIASENLRKPDIASEIEAEFRRRTIGLDEVLVRLSEQATANVGDFIVVNPDGDRIAFNPEMLRENGRLIKRVRANTTVKYSQSGDQSEYTSLDIELYDAQHALEVIGRHMGLVSGRVEVNWRQEAAKRGIPASEIFEAMVKQFSAHLLENGD